MGTATALGANLALLIVTARFLGPTEVGSANLVIVLVGLWRATVLIGAEHGILQAGDGIDSSLGLLIRQTRRTSLVMGVPSLSAVLAVLLATSRLSALEAVAGLVIFLAEIAFQTQATPLRYHGLWRRLGTLQAISAVGAASIGIFWAVAISASSVALLLASASIPLLGALVLRQAPSINLGSAVDEVAVRDWRGRARSNMYTHGAAALSTSVDNLVAGLVFGPASLGLYSRAYRVMTLPANLVGDISDSILVRSLASSRGHDLHLRVVRLLCLDIALFVPASIAIGRFAAPLVVFLFGDDWSEAGPLLAALAAAMTARIVTKHCSSGLKSGDRSAVLARSMIALLFIVFVGVGVGAAISTLGLAVAVAVSLNVAAVMFVVVTAIVLQMRWEHVVLLLQLAVSLAAGSVGLLYLGAGVGALVALAAALVAAASWRMISTTLGSTSGPEASG